MVQPSPTHLCGMIKLSIFNPMHLKLTRGLFPGHSTHTQKKAGSGTIFSPNPFHIPNSEVGCLMGLMSSLGIGVASSGYDFSNTSLT